MADIWWNCYNQQWADELVPEAFSHPAKGAPGLSKRIYDHALDEGWLVAGDLVIDPFGGVAGFGLQAMAHGLSWVGVELEQRFVDLGNQNIDLWRKRYALWPKFGSAVLLQGDSRNLLAVVEASGAAGVVSSPPFATMSSTDIEFMQKHADDTGRHFEKPGGQSLIGSYGQTIGNLGNLRATEAGFAGAISSPPFTDGGMGDDRKFGGIHDPGQSGLARRNHSAVGGLTDYGSTPGQLGAMRAGDFDAAVSSPPFENQVAQQDRTFRMPHDSTGNINVDYGNSEGQIGASSGDDFWQAARVIVAQTYAALRPGGHAIWVVKSFVHNKQRVDFPGQWRALCESCGFVMLHEHHAMLVSEVEQLSLDGGKSKRTERKSFFRRLAEKNGSPRIDYEVVLCMGKDSA